MPDLTQDPDLIGPPFRHPDPCPHGNRYHCADCWREAGDPEPPAGQSGTDLRWLRSRASAPPWTETMCCWGEEETP